MHASAILNVYEADDPAAALHAACARVGKDLPLRAAFWVDGEDREVIASWPGYLEPSDELRDALLHTLRTEVFPLGSEFPHDSERFPAADVLFLPLGPRTDRCGAAGFVADRGSFGEDLDDHFAPERGSLAEDLDGWTRLGEALARVARHHRETARAATECDDLRQRVEESEALHTLGLAANRTLNPDEVFALVARFTRTLLGAHYVVVHTRQDGELRCAASVGVRDAAECPPIDPFAERVVQARTVVTVGGGAEPVGESAFHAAEGMRAGVGIPLSLFGETFGAIVVGYRRAYSPTPRDHRLALTLAGHAAVAISNARLHGALGDRSAALQLALDELQRLSQAKERFFASINHELRTPLSAVIGYQTLLLDGAAGELPERAIKYLGSSLRAAQNLLVLVNDILDLAKLAAGKMEVQLRPCALGEVVEEALATIRPLAEPKGIHVAVPSLEGLPPIETDPNRLRQILLNLLSNAVKFTEAGEVRLSATRLDAGSGDADAERSRHWIEIRVSDTGAGISAEALPRIFEEFEQATANDAYCGTGLGLPISRRLARLLDGELWAESEVGAGSTFVLRLPDRAFPTAAVA